MNTIWVYFVWQPTVACKKKKNIKDSLETKRRQWLYRKAERKQLQRGLYHTVTNLKEEKECLSQKIALELKCKENHFKVWQETEQCCVHVNYWPTKLCSFVWCLIFLSEYLTYLTCCTVYGFHNHILFSNFIYYLLLLDEMTEVAIAVLHFLLESKSSSWKHQEFTSPIH